MAGEESNKPNQVLVLPTREGYDRWAEFYDTDGNPLIGLEERHFSRLAGNVNGLKVADIGCGTGRQALLLSQAGARVTAVDFSRGMMRAALTKPGADLLSFVCADLAKPLPFCDASFDAASCCLVIDHIAGVDAFFSELRRICRRGGAVLISAMHPAMMLRGVLAQFHDPASGDVVRPLSAPNQLSDYVMAIARAGLRIDHLSEHFVDDELAARFPRAQKYLGWPMLLLMRLGVS